MITSPTSKPWKSGLADLTTALQESAGGGYKKAAAPRSNLDVLQGVVATLDSLVDALAPSEAQDQQQALAELQQQETQFAAQLTKVAANQERLAQQLIGLLSGA